MTPVRAVRIAAAEGLVDVPENHIPPDSLADAFRRGKQRVSDLAAGSTPTSPRVGCAWRWISIAAAIWNRAAEEYLAALENRQWLQRGADELWRSCITAKES